MSALDDLLKGLFDYAGMFPPASLPFEEALERSARLPTLLKRPPLVGSDFVMGADLLQALDKETLARCGFARERKVRICALGSPLGSPGCRPLADGVARFNSQRWAVSAPESVVSYELRLPGELFDRPGEALVGVEALREALRGDVRLFLEPDWPKDQWQARLGLFPWLAKLNRPGAVPVGLKVRASGPTAVDAAALALIVPRVNALKIPFKATAGLHHPIPEPGRYGNPLGFLNLAAALRLEKALGPGRFGPKEVLACLQASDAGDFSFDGSLRWRGFEAPAGELAAAIRDLPFSVGSCSVEEPDADLCRLFG